MEAKQVIVIRKDLNMRKGKMVAQGAHASMAALLSLAQSKDPSRDFVVIPLEGPVREWLNGLFTKICVSVDSEEELLAIKAKADDAGIMNSVITDSGLTEFQGVPTITCMAIGPDWPENINAITGHLKLL